METDADTHGMEVIEAIDFDEKVRQNPGNTVVVFTAEWSGPCRMLMPILESALKERNSGPRVVRVNVDEAQGLTKKLEIRGLPTLVGFRDGVQTESLSGTFSKGDLHRFLDLLTH